jgi:phosphoglycolate phosphatase
MAGGWLEGEGPLDPSFGFLEAWILLSKYEAVIFDLDGTLITLPVDWVAVRDGLRDYLVSEDPFLPLFKTLEAKLTQRPEARSGVFSLVDDFEAAAAKHSKLLPGVMSVIKYLSSRSKLAVVTMQGRKVCSRLLEKHGLGRFIEFSLTREDSLDRSVQLQVALKRLSTSSRRTLFVGDRINDFESGRKVGVSVVLVGHRKAEDLGQVKQFETMTGLKEYLYEGSP